MTCIFSLPPPKIINFFNISALSFLISIENVNIEFKIYFQKLYVINFVVYKMKIILSKILFMSKIVSFRSTRSELI